MSANFSSCADLACFKPYRSPVIVRLENISIIMVSAWLILPDMEKRHVTAMMKKALCVHVHSSLLCLSLTNVDQELQAFVATGEKIFEMVINKEQTKPVLILVLRVTWKSNLTLVTQTQTYLWIFKHCLIWFYVTRWWNCFSTFDVFRSKDLEAIHTLLKPAKK